jgi:hypothetical protein
MRGAVRPFPQYSYTGRGSVKKKHKDEFNFTFTFLCNFVTTSKVTGWKQMPEKEDFILYVYVNDYFAAYFGWLLSVTLK